MTEQLQYVHFMIVFPEDGSKGAPHAGHLKMVVTAILSFLLQRITRRTRSFILFQATYSKQAAIVETRGGKIEKERQCNTGCCHGVDIQDIPIEYRKT